MATCISDLPADVVFSIFLYCDIASVVLVGQTCRYLHDLAFHKSVWLALLQDLKRRFILSDAVSPNLEESSTSELIKVVKRLLTGPDTWSPTSAGFTPEVAQKITLHPTGILNWETEPQLSPSGRFVLLSKLGTLECWDVGADRMTWRYLSGSEVLVFAVDEVVDDDKLVIMTCESTYSGPRTHCIQIIELDPRTGTDTNLLKVSCPPTPYDAAFMGPVIRGSVATVALSTSLHFLLVLDWTVQSAFVVYTSDTRSNVADIIPGHLILQTFDTGDASTYLYLIDLWDALRIHGVPLNLSNANAFPFNSVDLNQLPKILRQEVVTPRAERSFRTGQQLYVHARPLHRDTYRIWVYSAGDALLCSYDLALTPTPVWRERTRAPSRRGVYYRQISYSGHAQWFERVAGRGVVHQILPPSIPAPFTRGELDLAGAADVMDVSAYSGALTFAREPNVVVLYFR
ncbi:hypothetical protein C8R46DRAFT_1125648 [Mycena filopes]|nr:hypothetical protein C8R46DRAFT_1125648 [Mycena filopes]